MLKKLPLYTLALIGLTVFFASCKKDYESAQTIDSTKIKAYIAANNLTTMVEDSAKTGYYYQIVTPGTGDNYKLTDSVLYSAEAKGLENGTVYIAKPGYYNLGTLVAYTGGVSATTGTTALAIPAILDVMKKLKPGGSARILLPSYLAWGRNGSVSVPSNENIDITVTTFADKNQAALDDRLLAEFVATKGLTMTKDPSGVYYNISAAGSGTYPITKYSEITSSYTGRYLDGTVFDSNTAATFSMIPGSSNGIISGIQNLLPGKLEKDGKVRILIPSRLGYGTSGSGTGGVPGNTVLDFDFEVTSVAAP